jgi:Protein of unknown function (DUF3108)
VKPTLIDARCRARRALRAARVVLLGAAALSVVGVAGADELRPFQATYAWIWHGMTVAVSTLKLEKTGDTWTYTSRSEPRGIGKMVSQRPRTTSVLRVSEAGVQPQSYQGDDGTSSTKRTVNIHYDWAQQRVTGVYEDTQVDLPLKPGVQDDSSVQVAMMVELLRGRTPERFSLIDKNSVREYRYKREGEETLKTPFGDVATVIYSSQRANSPHINRYWCAPERGFVPMRVQQKRGDDVQWTMEIQSFRRE